jgi:hypothetical protein
MYKEFVNKYLKNVKWYEDKNYQVEGLLNNSNKYYKFDIRYLNDFPQNITGKLIDSDSKADKVLFEDDKNWILIDVEEFVKYMTKHNLREIKVEELLFNIDWNIILPKK